MVHRGLGQRRDGEGEEPAVAIFVHNLLKHKKQEIDVNEEGEGREERGEEQEEKV